MSQKQGRRENESQRECLSLTRDRVRDRIAVEQAPRRRPDKAPEVQPEQKSNLEKETLLQTGLETGPGTKSAWEEPSNRTRDRQRKLVQESEQKTTVD